MKIDKNIIIFPVINSSTDLHNDHHNTCPLNVRYEADNIDKNKFQVSLPGVCPLPTSPPRLKGHHVPPLEPNFMNN